jgi:hypothetical protein
MVGHVRDELGSLDSFLARTAISLRRASISGSFRSCSRPMLARVLAVTAPIASTGWREATQVNAGKSGSALVGTGW